MKQKVLRILSALLVFAMAFSCVSCSGGNKEPQPSVNSSSSSDTAPASSQENAGNEEEDAKLLVWVPNMGEEIFTKAYNENIQNFMKDHPGMSYDIVFIPWGEFFTKINASFAGGTGPDVFGVGYGQLGTLQYNGNLLALDDYIDSDWSGWKDIRPRILELGQKDGKTYGFLFPNTRLLLYRKDIAEQQGVPEEEIKFDTTEELIELSRRMTVKENGKTIIGGLGLATTGAQTVESRLFMFSLFQGPTTLWNDDYTASFSSPQYVQAMETMKMMVDEGTVLLDDPGGDTQFTNGLCAMVFDQTTTMEMAEQSFPGQIGMATPGPGTLLIGEFMACNADSKYPKQSAELLAYLFGEDAQKLFNKVAGYIPSRQSLEEWYIENEPRGNGATVMASFENAYPYNSGMNYKFLDMVNLLRPAIESVFYSDADAKQALEECAEQYNALLK